MLGYGDHPTVGRLPGLGVDLEFAWRMSLSWCGAVYGCDLSHGWSSMPVEHLQLSCQG